jgi:predicted Zn finger-like uncharacterized protein
MKITCQSCQSKYNVADEKVQGKIVKIRCRKCGSTIVVQGNGGAAANGSSASNGANGAGVGAEAEGVQWHVNVGEGEPRTMSLAELIEAYNAGSIAQDTFIWTDGMDDWKPLAEVEPVISALHAGHAPAAPPMAAEPEYRPPVDEIPYVAPAAAPAPAAVAMAAAEAPVEPRRAAVKREARARDLFAGGGGGEEVQTSAPAHPQMMNAGAVDDAASKLTGQRNENSVLFSLAVLTKEGGDRAPEEEAPKSTSKNSDDSGLIDLKALALKAESMRPAAMADAGAFASPLGLGGPSMGLGAPLGVLGSPLGEAPAKSKLPLYIGLGAGGVLLIVLGMFIGIKGLGSSAPAPEPSATVAAAPTATATAEPTATASATASAEASATAAASAAAPKPKPAVGVYHPPAGGAPKPAAAAAAPGGAAATPAATPPPPKKAGSDCGCNGDLMCLMKCSTGH